MMNYRLLNAVRDIQVASKEANLYAGSIDGKWGKGSAAAVTTLLHDYNYRVNGSRAETSPLPYPTQLMDETAALKSIQTNLKLLKLYSGDADGLMGPGTWGGFVKLVNSYKAYNKIPYLGLAWSKKVSSEFTAKVIAGCRARGWWGDAPNCLMACMYFESGGTFDPAKQNNGGSKYFGLIQFGKMAAADLKIPLEDIIKMSQLDQLDLVFKYFDMWAGRGKKYARLEDLYLTIFYPSAVGKKPDEILFRKDSPIDIEAKSYLQNNGFDFNKDGVITVGEINTRLYAAYYDGMLPSNRSPATAALY